MNGLLTAVVLAALLLGHTTNTHAHDHEGAPPPEHEHWRIAPESAPPLHVPFEDHKPKVGITPGSYVAGGLLGTFVGFGTGHMIQGRWTRTGWIFTVGKVVALGVMGGGIARVAGTRGIGKHDQAGIGMLIGGALAFSLLYIGEIIDVWRIPGDMELRRYSPRRLSQRNLKPRFTVAPKVASGTVGLDLAVVF